MNLNQKRIDEKDLNLNQREDRSNGSEFESKGGSIK
jgi:hypothetical protein